MRKVFERDLAQDLEALEAQLVGEEDDAEVNSSVESRDSSYGERLRALMEENELNAVDLARNAQISLNTILALLEGRTERPQRNTRLKIERALGKPDESSLAESQADTTWYYTKLAFTEEEIEQVPSEPGVYVIHDRLGRPSYVGVAHKGRGGIRGRLRQHNQARWSVDKKVAATFSYAITTRMPHDEPSVLAQSIEKILIKFMGTAVLINEKDVEKFEA